MDDTATPPQETPPANVPPLAQEPAAARGRPKGSKSRKTLERELQKAKAKLKALEDVNPFAAEPKDQANTATGEAPAGEAAPNAPPGDAEAAPELGTEVATALAPAYYGLVNTATRILVKNSPAHKNKPEEARRLASAIALDGTKGSADREAIDPPLILVLAKLRLTPELALLLATFGMVSLKYAMATGDEDVRDLVGSVISVQAKP